MNKKIHGSYDFETYVDNNNTLVPYAIAFTFSEKRVPSNCDFVRTWNNKCIICPEFKPLEYGSDYTLWLIEIWVKDSFTKKNNKHIFWAHNGGRFDSIFIIESLTQNQRRSLW